MKLRPRPIPSAVGHAPEPAVSERPSGLVFLIALAALVLTLAGVRQVRDIFGPAFLALTLLLAVRPLHRWLVAKKWPRPLAAAVVLLILYTVLLGLVALIGFAVAELVQKLPEYSEQFNALYDQALRFGERFGVGEDAVGRYIENFNWSSLSGLASKFLSGLSGASGQIVTILIVMFFLAIDSAQVAGRFETLTKWRPYLADSLHRFSYQVRQYWVVSTIFGLIVAVLDVAALMIIGVPLAITWGVFSFVTNYIPNVGFVLGLIPPALIALLDGGFTTMIVVVIVYTVINLVIQTIIQPKFTGDAVGLNTTVTFLSLLFWSVVVGPLGAILAVPLTLFVKAVFVDSDPNTRWVNVFFKDKDVDADVAEDGRSADLGISDESDEGEGSSGGKDEGKAEDEPALADSQHVHDRAGETSQAAEGMPDSSEKA